MTAPPPPQTPMDLLRDLDQRLLQIELQIAAAGAPAAPPPPPPPPRRWADRAMPSGWAELVDWVDNLLADYSIRGHEYLPPCWPAHPGVVEEMAALWRAWVNAVLTEQAAGLDGSAALTMWHTYWLAPCLVRLKSNIYDTVECRTNRGVHALSPITPTLTDQTFIPLPPGP